MLKKKKALYQIKLILDYLPDEEHELIPKDIIEYIDNNFEYDENIIIRPDIPLEKQNIDDNVFKILEEIIKKTEKNKNKKKIEEYLKTVEKSNDDFEAKIENVKLRKAVKSLENENKKIFKFKELIDNYQKVIKQQDMEIKKLKESNEKFQEQFKKLPGFLKK